MTTEIWGTTPDARVFSKNMSAYPPRDAPDEIVIPRLFNSLDSGLKVSQIPFMLLSQTINHLLRRQRGVHAFARFNYESLTFEGAEHIIYTSARNTRLVAQLGSVHRMVGQE